MANRLSKIYTRGGDRGSTSLGDGQRVDKDHPRIECIGCVDELNSALGLLRAEALAADLDHVLFEMQHRLFDLGGELAVPGRTAIESHDVSQLEQHIDRLNAELPPLEEFILPAGGRAAAVAHLARTACRRAERRVHALGRVEAINPQALAYLNRLSDLLFVIARTLARGEASGEVLWQPRPGSGR